MQIEAKEGVAGVVDLLFRVDDAKGDQAGVLLALPQPLEGGQLHRLYLGDLVGRLVPVEDREHRGEDTERGGDDDGPLGHEHVPAAQQVPTGDRDDEQGADQHGGTGRMGELVHRIGREGDLEEVLHLEAGGLGVEGLADRILHPGVGHQDPHRRQAGADCHHPGGKQVESLGNAVPAEEHDREEGGLEEEGEDALDGERRAEDIADHPRVVGPVGAELEFQDEPGGHADGEVDTEQLHPELGQPLPLLVAGAHVDGVVKGEDPGEPQGQRHEDPVVHGGQGELAPGPVDHAEVQIFDHNHSPCAWLREPWVDGVSCSST